MEVADWWLDAVTDEDIDIPGVKREGKMFGEMKNEEL